MWTAVNPEGRWGWLVLMVTVVLAGVMSTLSAGQPGPQPPDLSKMTVLRDVEYVPGGHERQRLDLYLPKGANPGGKRPLLVWVHGGAWLAGGKAPCPALRFVDQGYAVASINYRLSHEAKWPAQIYDCKAAVRFLRANA